MTGLKRNFVFLLLTTTLSSVASRSSSAETKLPKELEGKATILKKGQRTSIPGILLTRRALVDLLKNYERRVRLAEARAEKAKRDATAKVGAADAAAQIRLEAEKSKAAACLADQIRRERIYEDAIKRGQSPPSVWRSPWFTGSVGAILGAGICVGAAAATSR